MRSSIQRRKRTIEAWDYGKRRVGSGGESWSPSVKFGIPSPIPSWLPPLKVNFNRSGLSGELVPWTCDGMEKVCHALTKKGGDHSIAARLFQDPEPT